MDYKKFTEEYFQAVVEQDAARLRTFFCEDAVIRWHNTNEEFNTEEFITANCEYPFKWHGEIERFEQNDGSLIITVAHIWSDSMSFHVTSFIQMKSNKISIVDEYWGDDGEVPQWRTEKHIGKPITK